MRHFFWRLAGYNINKSKKFLKKLKFLSNEEFWKIQKSRRNDIFIYHYNNSFFYKEIVDNYNINIDIFNWGDIPIMKKENFQNFSLQSNSKLYKKFQIYSANTSGSTGQPFTFYKDKKCHSLCWANMNLLYSDFVSTSVIEKTFFVLLMKFIGLKSLITG